VSRSSGAGDFIGSAIAERFAAEGYLVYAGRRTADKLQALKTRSRPLAGRCLTRGLDARVEEDIAAFIAEAEAAAPLEVCIFNPGANVNFPILETTERVSARSGAGLLRRLPHRPGGGRAMLPRGNGSIFFTGATASLRGGVGYAAFASAKFGLRAVAQSMSRELGPKGIHVAHLIIDAGVDTAFVRERIRPGAATRRSPTSSPAS